MVLPAASTPPSRPPDWRLPPGVAPGTWDYAHTAEVADSYDQFLRGTSLTELDLRLVHQLLPPAADLSSIVADLGCGTGRASGLIVRAGYRMLGIDLSQPMLKRLRAKAAGREDRILPLRANLVNLDCLADQSIDHAVCLFSTLGMIRSRRHRRTALAHMHRMLRPGGRLIVHAHNRWAALRDPGGLRHLGASWWRSTRNRNFDFGDRTYAYRGLPNMFLHSFGRRELWADLKSAGFRVERTIPLNIHGSDTLRGARWLPGLRAGGFIVAASATAAFEAGLSHDR